MERSVTAAREDTVAYEGKSNLEAPDNDKIHESTVTGCLHEVLGAGAKVGMHCQESGETMEACWNYKQSGIRGEYDSESVALNPSSSNNNMTSPLKENEEKLEVPGSAIRSIDGDNPELSCNRRGLAKAETVPVKTLNKTCASEINRETATVKLIQNAAADESLDQSERQTEDGSERIPASIEEKHSTQELGQTVNAPKSTPEFSEFSGGKVVLQNSDSNEETIPIQTNQQQSRVDSRNEVSQSQSDLTLNTQMTQSLNDPITCPTVTQELCSNKQVVQSQFNRRSHSQYEDPQVKDNTERKIQGYPQPSKQTDVRLDRKHSSLKHRPFWEFDIQAAEMPPADRRICSYAESMVEEVNRTTSRNNTQESVLPQQHMSCTRGEPPSTAIFNAIPHLQEFSDFHQEESEANDRYVRMPSSETRQINSGTSETPKKQRHEMVPSGVMKDKLSTFSQLTTWVTEKAEVVPTGRIKKDAEQRRNGSDRNVPCIASAIPNGNETDIDQEENHVSVATDKSIPGRLSEVLLQEDQGIFKDIRQCEINTNNDGTCIDLYTMNSMYTLQSEVKLAVNVQVGAGNTVEVEEGHDYHTCSDCLHDLVQCINVQDNSPSDHHDQAADQIFQIKGKNPRLFCQIGNKNRVEKKTFGGGQTCCLDNAFGRQFIAVLIVPAFADLNKNGVTKTYGIRGNFNAFKEICQTKYSLCLIDHDNDFFLFGTTEQSFGDVYNSRHNLKRELCKLCIGKPVTEMMNAIDDLLCLVFKCTFSDETMDSLRGSFSDSYIKTLTQKCRANYGDVNSPARNSSVVYTSVHDDTVSLLCKFDITSVQEIAF